MKKRRPRWGFAALAGLFLLALALWPLADRWFPFPTERLSYYPASRLFTDREGLPIRLALGPGDLDCRPSYRYNPADWIGHAIVAAEDRRFWTHKGLDPAALLRAIGQNILAGRIVSGASTLSTQVIRLIEPRRRTLVTKLIETFRARQLEKHCTKENILEQYLNRAPFGGNRVGIEAAARRYFSKDPSELTLGEAALLAGLPQSPARLRPDRHLKRARARQAYVLTRMEACGMITAAQRRSAQRQPIRLCAQPYPFAYPHFANYVLDRADPPTVSAAGLRTTLDARLQQLAADALARQLTAMDSGPALSGAAVILEVRSGAVRAMVGSPDYFNTTRAGQVNGAVMPRSPGSALKPLLFARAIERGELTPAMVLADVPREFKDYRPENYDGEFLGLVSARDALALSLNLPALALIERIGVSDFHQTLRRLGLTTLRRPAGWYGLGLALGNAEVTLVELANAYACLARGGLWWPSRCLESAVGARPIRIFSEETAWLVMDMLAGDERAIAVTGHRALVRLPPVAWKTGTSSGFRDAWTIACNPEYVVGIWIGRPDGKPAPDLIGVQAAAPAAWDIFRALYPDNAGPWFARPKGLCERTVCVASGCPAGPHCRETISDWYVQGMTRHTPCPVHRRADGSETWPPAVTAFLKQHSVRPASTPALASVKILTPAANVVRPIPSPANAVSGLPLTARSTSPGDWLYWFANGRYLGEAKAQDVFWWNPAPGSYELVCANAQGQSDQRALRVE